MTTLARSRQLNLCKGLLFVKNRYGMHNPLVDRRKIAIQCGVECPAKHKSTAHDEDGSGRRASKHNVVHGFAERSECAHVCRRKWKNAIERIFSVNRKFKFANAHELACPLRVVRLAPAERHSRSGAGPSYRVASQQTMMVQFFFVLAHLC